ncbi:serine hydrolase domain-containing protein [Phenylobacterium kunshanense]|nr:serine hydrolase domain-containing protein [Phenylobacterium kunshanense]
MITRAVLDVPRVGAEGRVGWTRRLATLAIGFVVLGWSAASHAAPASDDLRRIAAMEVGLKPAGAAAGARRLSDRMAELKVPGVSLAYFKDGRLHWTRTYGVADVAHPTPISPETRFQAASLTKPLAATVALRLVEAGALQLDEDVEPRLVSWKMPASELTRDEKVTLRRLLSHTAGLSVSGFPGYAQSAVLPNPVQVLSGAPPAITPPVVPLTTPGTKWSYSGGGYQVAELLMDDVTGTPFARLADRHVLGPAGMKLSSLEQPLPARLASKAATGHNFNGAPLAGRWHVYPELASAGLWTTPSDYARFMIGLQNAYAGRGPALVNRASARAMMTPVLNGYGLGWNLVPRGKTASFEHRGGNAGFQSYAAGLLDGSRQGFVIMTNGDRGMILVNEIADALAAAYDWPARR